MQQISDDVYDAYLEERGLTRTQYTTMELLAVASAREVPDGAFVFAGSGVANNIASFADKVLVVMVQEERRFPESVEYITSVAGWRGPREKGESRWDYGLGRGGELVMISDLCIMRSDPDTGLLELDTVFPGISFNDVVNNTGWSLDTRKSKEFPPPTEESLKALPMLNEPSQIYLGRKSKREAAAAQQK